MNLAEWIFFSNWGGRLFFTQSVWLILIIISESACSLFLMALSVAIVRIWTFRSGFERRQDEKTDTDFRSILPWSWGSEIPFFNRKIRNDFYFFFCQGFLSSNLVSWHKNRLGWFRCKFHVICMLQVWGWKFLGIEKFGWFLVKINICELISLEEIEKMCMIVTFYFLLHIWMLLLLPVYIFPHCYSFTCMNSGAQGCHIHSLQV